MSEVRIGKNRGKDNYKSTPILMIDKKTNEIIKEFESIHLAGEFLGDVEKQANIWKCCTGKIQSAYNYKWKYKNGNN